MHSARRSSHLARHGVCTQTRCNGRQAVRKPELKAFVQIHGQRALRHRPTLPCLVQSPQAPFVNPFSYVTPLPLVTRHPCSGFGLSPSESLYHTFPLLLGSYSLTGGGNEQTNHVVLCARRWGNRESVSWLALGLALVWPRFALKPRC